MDSQCLCLSLHSCCLYCQYLYSCLASHCLNRHLIFWLWLEEGLFIDQPLMTFGSLSHYPHHWTYPTLPLMTKFSIFSKNQHFHCAVLSTSLLLLLRLMLQMNIYHHTTCKLFFRIFDQPPITSPRADIVLFVLNELVPFWKKVIFVTNNWRNAPNHCSRGWQKMGFFTSKRNTVLKVLLKHIDTKREIVSNCLYSYEPLDKESTPKRI